MANYFTIIWAELGDQTPIPTDTVVDGSVSFERGWTSDYQADQNTDPLAKNIDRQKHNYLFNQIITAIQELQQGGVSTWIDNDGGGGPYPYLINALVLHNGQIWASVINSNTSEPGLDANWAVPNFVNIPDASTSAKGIIEIATNSEVIDGLDALRAITPAGLEARSSSVVTKGIVRLATSAETDSFDSSIAVTPSGLHSRDATEILTGLVELATISETQDGSDTVRVVTPAGLESRQASLTAKGLVELATTSETQAGAIATLAVTPNGLSGLTANEARRGLVELATVTETTDGVDSVRAVTPASIADIVLPAGGAAGQILSKTSPTDYDADWSAPFILPDPLLLGPGSASAPTYSFATATNSGMYGGPFDPVKIATNGTVAISWNGVQDTNFLGHNLFSTDDISNNGGGDHDIGTFGSPYDNIFLNNAPTISDARLKTDIGPIEDATDFLNRLDPRTFSFKPLIVPAKFAETGELLTPEKTISHGRPHTGFMAQDVKQAMTDHGLEDWAGYAYDEEEDMHTLRLFEFTAYLVAGLQEQDVRIQEQATLITELSARIAALENVNH